MMSQVLLVVSVFTAVAGEGCFASQSHSNQCFSSMARFDIPGKSSACYLHISWSPHLSLYSNILLHWPNSADNALSQPRS